MELLRGLFFIKSYVFVRIAAVKGNLFVLADSSGAKWVLGYAKGVSLIINSIGTVSLVKPFCFTKVGFSFNHSIGFEDE